MKLFKNQKNKKRLLQGSKIVFTTVALYYVFKKVHFTAFYGYLQQVKIFWFFLAFVAFSISKIISATSLQHFSESRELHFNIVLC